MPRLFEAWLRNAITHFDAAVRDLIKEIAPTITYSGIELRPDPKSAQAFHDMAYQVSAYFLGMPQMPNSRKHTENIFLIGLLHGVVVDKKTAQLKSYATEVSYCRMKNLSNQNGELKAMAGYHFDFESTSKINHPIFHAQQNLSAGFRFFEGNKNFDIPELPDQHAEIRTLRIPTPQMDIFSAIVMILADHIVQPSDESREPFIKFLSVVNQHLLPINFDDGSIDVPKKFLEAHPIHVHDWYPVNLG